MLKLYYAANSCALASHIALEEAGADYEAIAVDFAAGAQKSADYLAINPKGRVPALVTGQGVLTETPALLLYIAQSHPAANLAPLDNPFALAEAQAFNNYLCSTVHVAHAHRRRGQRYADDPAAWEAMRAKVPQAMAECFAYIERDLIKGPWVLGRDYSICDPYLFTLAGWLGGDGVDRKDFPNVERHFQAMSERGAVQNIMPAHAVG
jgi:glutathione S-transferase